MDKPRGGALLSALFVITLVAIAATAMALRLQLDIYRTQLVKTSDKLYLASQSVMFWSMDLLKQVNGPQQIASTQTKGLVFPSKYSHLYPGIITSGRLVDLQGRFNLNNLQDKKAQQMFYLLLTQAVDGLSDAEAKTIVRFTRQWILNYDKKQQNQDSAIEPYLKQASAYVVSHQPMVSVSEFRLIKGVDQRIFEAIKPYITALPEKTTINLNSAEPIVLKSLGNGLTDDKINTIIEQRRNNGQITAKNLPLLLSRLNISPDQATIDSQFYLSIARVKAANDLNLNVYSIIKRQKDKKGKISVKIVSQSLNTLP